MTDPQFVHLHLHSEYSLVDGLVRIDECVETIASQKSSAIAITDQCNLFAMVKFYQAAESAGIKPIIGTDIWLINEADASQPFRLILLCQNMMGYRNLTEIVSRSYTEGQFADKPQIKKAWLREKNTGLIAIASARESDIAKALLGSDSALAEKLLEDWVAIFNDRFYLELTRTNRSGEETYNQAAVVLAEKAGAALVATNDVRFIKREDFEAHETRVCIHEGVTLSDPKRSKNYSEAQYLKSPVEMQALFSDLPEALENSVEIAKRCTFELKLGEIYLPNYPVPVGKTIQQYFIDLAHEGLKNKFANQPIPDVHKDRLNIELSVLNAMGYAGYFLIVADFIQWARDNKIPVGPGRGSGAGSLVAFSLGITGLDPLQYDLLFERFLNPERVSMPDFDIDFCMEGRDRVIDYVANTYGRESVSQIITYGTMAAKAVIRDVGRALGHPYGFVDKIAKLIPLELGITLEKALNQEEVLKQRYSEESEVKTLIDLAKKLEGITRNAGKHAGGVVIAPSKLIDFTPLYCDAKEGHLLTQFDKDDVETIGLVKFDFLGLRTLTIIDWAVEAINQTNIKNNQTCIDIEKIPLDDLKVFDLLKACNTTAVFQLESRGMKDLVKRLQPDTFEEIIALVALFRPGPLQSGMVDDFINRKHGRERPEYLHPKLTHILKPTYGVILYQEQVMQIAQVLAGYTLGAADLLRRAMGKKKPEEMAKQRAIFVQGSVERGVSEHTATHIFDLMEKFAGYGFNKSHSAAYALITYQTAWLKTHYKEAFMAAVLSSDMANTDKIVIFVHECAENKISIIPPDINKSLFKFSADAQNRVLYGLGAIKGVGEAAIESIIEARTSRPFQDLFDFCSRIDSRKVSRRVLEALIRAGAFDSLGIDFTQRAEWMETLSDAIHASEQIAKNRSRGQTDLFGDSFSAEDIKISAKPKNIEPWSESVRLQGEKDTLGLYLTGHPLTQYEEELSQIRTSTIRDLKIERNKRYVIAGLIVTVRTLMTRKGDRMAFVTLDDRTGRQEVAVFSDQYRENKEILAKDNLVIVTGEVSIDTYSGGYKMRCTDIMSLEKSRLKSAKFLKVVVSPSNLDENFAKKLMETIRPHQVQEGCPVQIIYERNESSVFLRLGVDWRVNPKETLVDSLKILQGITSVDIEY
jgi:DNA polymerase-3 subunit alpha